MRRKHVLVTAAVGAAALLGSLIGAAVPAAAETTATFVPIPFEAAQHVVTDAHGHLFISGGSQTDGVWAASADGAGGALIPDQQGAYDMVLSADGSTLYVALFDAGAISAIDTSTLAEKQRWTTPGRCPQDLALLGTSLWFSSPCAGQYFAPGVLRLGTGAVEQSGADILGPVDMTPVPGYATSLVVAARSSSPSSIVRYVVSGTTLTAAASYTGTDTNFADMAVDPDGTHLVVASGWPYHHTRLKISDLTEDGSYASGTYPRGVATSTTHGGLVAAATGDPAGPELYIYRAGQLVRTFDSGTSGLLWHAVAWSHDGRYAYVVTSNLLFVIDQAFTTDTIITVDGPPSQVPGRTVTLTGTVASPIAPRAGLTLAVSRTEGDVIIPLPSVVSGPDGSFTIVDHAFTKDSVYEVSYPGDATTGPGVAWHVTAAVRLATTLALDGPAAVVPSGAVHLTGSLSDPEGAVGGAALTVSRTDAAGTAALPDLTTASDGTFALDDSLDHGDATYTVAYSGSFQRAPARTDHQVAAVRTVSTLTLAAPSTAARGVAYRVTGVLTADGQPIEGATVTYRRTDLSGTRTFSLSTNSLGVVSYRDVPAVGGPVTWSLAWAGDGTRAPAAASQVVTVARTATALSVRTSASSYAYGSRATITIQLGSTYNRRDVYVYARPLGPTAPLAAPGTLVAHARATASGTVVLTYLMRARTTFTVRFAGDYRYLPAARAVSPNVVSRVSIQTAGYASVSSGTFVFRGSVAYFRSLATPLRRTGCVSFQAQIYLAGRWQSAGGTCATTSPASGYYAYAVAHRMYVGYRFRVRAYVAANSYSTAGSSGWLYFRFA